MGFLKSCLLVCVLLASCSDAATKREATASDTTMRSLDSSKMINNQSRLPQDSTVTVTQ